MKKTLFFFAALSILPIIKLSAQCAQTANIYSFTFGGHDYEVVKELKNWTDAAACAVERGGYLVEINSLEEQNAVYNAIITGAGVSSTYITISNGGGIAYVWIGATDNNTEGTWLWDGNNDNIGVNFWNGQGANGANNGTAVGGAYINWGGTSLGTPNEPDNYGSGQNNAAIALAGWPSGTTLLGIAGEWNDIIESSAIYYVIEYNTTSSINSHEKPAFEVYPNPANDVLIIKNENFENIEIVDFMGRVIGNYNISTIDISGYSKGIYFVKIYNGEGIYTEKIVIQ